LVAVRAPKPLPARLGRKGTSRADARRTAEYRRILVPLVDAKESEQAMDIVCQLAAEHGAFVTALTVIEVPVELPLEAHMIEEETEAKRVLELAHAVADLYGVNASVRLVRGREAGEAIVEEARRAKAQIIVLRAPRKRRISRRARLFGGTVGFVLKHAPCRVMIAAAPAD
jgi:nucleotide-binding universal stress UspA family protein